MAIRAPWSDTTDVRVREAGGLVCGDTPPPPASIRGSFPACHFRTGEIITDTTIVTGSGGLGVGGGPEAEAPRRGGGPCSDEMTTGRPQHRLVKKLVGQEKAQG